MRTMIYFTAVSLDGFIAGPGGELDWLFSSGDYGYTPFYETVDCLVMGRKTWDTVRSFEGSYPHPGKPAYVFTHQAAQAIAPREPVPEFQPITQDPTAFVRYLKSQSGGGIWLVGGGQIAGVLERAGLIDRLVLSIHPVTLGGGARLFAELGAGLSGAPSRQDWRLEQKEIFPDGLVQLTYEKG